MKRKPMKTGMRKASVKRPKTSTRKKIPMAGRKIKTESPSRTKRKY